MAISSKDFFWQYLEHWGRASPDEIALRFDEQAVTFRELDERTDRLAEAFLDELARRLARAKARNGDRLHPLAVGLVELLGHPLRRDGDPDPLAARACGLDMELHGFGGCHDS